MAQVAKTPDMSEVSIARPVETNKTNKDVIFGDKPPGGTEVSSPIVKLSIRGNTAHSTRSVM